MELDGPPGRSASCELRTTRGARRWERALFFAGLLLVSVAIIAPAGANLPSAASFAGSPGPHTESILAGVGHSGSSSTLVGSVVASLNGYGTSPTMKHVKVDVFSSDCTGPPSPTSCPLIATTHTNSRGNFGFDLPSGTYYVSALPDASLHARSYPEGFGGATVVASSPSSSVQLTVYPYIGYGNVSIVLPDYQCLSSYLNNFDGAGPGCQNPVLSWTQDGAYYINRDDQLEFYSFINQTGTVIARWTPLYQTFPSRAMIPNELFSTQDGAYIYGWGTTTPGAAVLTAEALNITTHRVFLYNFTGFGTSAVASNGQVEMTGWDGNDSQFTVILANGSVYDHDLWHAGQRLVGTLDFFEANNVYWEPYLNGYVDVEAGGSTDDLVEEWQLSGPLDDMLERTYLSQWTTDGIPVNGVGGVSFNLTSRQLYVEAEYSGLVYSVAGDGTIQSLLLVTDYYPPGVPPAVQVGNGAASDRSTLVATGPIFANTYQSFYNDSWLVSMVPGHLGFYSTNVSPYFYDPITTPFAYAWVQWYQEGAFYNTSYLISAQSYACNSVNPGPCTINGGDGAAVGTIWWLWKLGLPEFPCPAAAPSAEPNNPGPTDIDHVHETQTSITLSWTPPSGTGVLNYTVAWGTTTRYTHFVSVEGGQRSYTIPGLSTDTRYYFSVEAWNLHFHGTSSGLSTAKTRGTKPSSGPEELAGHSTPATVAPLPRAPLPFMNPTPRATVSSAALVGASGRTLIHPRDSPFLGRVPSRAPNGWPAGALSLATASRR